MAAANTLPLSPDQLLSTTRSVRRRLDLERSVEPELIRECLELAVQAPTGSNAQRWHFMVVTDAAKRQAIGDFYQHGWKLYEAMPGNAGTGYRGSDPQRQATQERVMTGAKYLADNIARVPVHVIACLSPRPEKYANPVAIASQYGSIIPAVWSFMLAARARGLGSCYTTMHLVHEQDIAELLGIPFEKVAQVALLPVAHTVGTDFEPAPREPLDSVVSWNSWSR